MRFLRKVIVKIGIPGGSSRSFSDYDVSCRIDKTNMSGSNKATVQIYGVGQGVAALAERDGAGVTVNAGYGDSPPLLFVGNIDSAEFGSKSPGTLLEIKAEDSLANYGSDDIRLTLAGPTNAEQAIRSVANKMQMNIARLSLKENLMWNQGVVLHGSSRDVLTRLTQAAGVKWHILDSEIHISPEEETTLESAVVVSPETGLVGSVSKTKYGIKYSYLLDNSTMNPDRVVDVRDGLNNGFYRVSKTNYVLSTHEKSFYANCEAVSL